MGDLGWAQVDTISVRIVSYCLTASDRSPREDPMGDGVHIDDLAEPRFTPAAVEVLRAMAAMRPECDLDADALRRRAPPRPVCTTSAIGTTSGASTFCSPR